MFLYLCLSLPLSQPFSSLSPSTPLSVCPSLSLYLSLSLSLSLSPSEKLFIFIVSLLVLTNSLHRFRSSFFRSYFSSFHCPSIGHFYFISLMSDMSVSVRLDVCSLLFSVCPSLTSAMLCSEGKMYFLTRPTHFLICLYG